MKFRMTPQRLEGETYEEYKVRRKLVNRCIKQDRKGRVFHDSATKGTYRKEVKL